MDRSMPTSLPREVRALVPRGVLTRAVCRHAAPLMFAAVSVLCTGCPALNRWSGPNEDPFFSVPNEDTPAHHTTFATPSLSDTAREIADQPSAPAPRRDGDRAAKG